MKKSKTTALAKKAYKFSVHAIANTLLLTSVSIHAQQAANSKQSVKSDDANPQSWQIERIEIEGRRNNSYAAKSAHFSRAKIPLLELSQSIQVLTPALIEDLDLHTLSDALGNVSGAVASMPSEALLVNPLLRGFEAEIFVDGLLGYADTAVIDPSSLIGVERIEVAKGPTSTLYGGGTGAPVGGLINVVTKSPQTQSFATYGLRANSMHAIAPSIDVNRVLTDDVGFRVAAEYLDSKDAIDDVNIKRLAVYPSLKVDLSADTQLMLKGFYTDVEYLEYSGLPFVVANNDAVDPFQFTGAKDAPLTRIQNRSLHASIDHELAKNWVLKTQARYYSNEFLEYSSFPFLSFFPVTDNQTAILSGILPASTKEWTADLSLAGDVDTKGMAHNVLFGITFDNTDYKGGTAVNFDPLGIIDYSSNNNDISWSPIDTEISRANNQYQSAAIYAQNQVSMGERWRVNLSFRLSRYTLKEQGDFVANGQFEYDFTEFDPRLGITYLLSDEVSFFAGYATGSRMPTFFNASSQAPQPETSKSGEFGVKFDSKNQELSGSIAYYYLVRDNIPTSAFPDPGSVQTGEQESKGIELDLIWEPNDELSLLLAYAYTNAQFTEQVVSGSNVFDKGNFLSRVPKNALRMSMRYQFSEKFGMGAGLSATDGSPLTDNNDFFTSSYATFDFQADYRFNERYKMQFSVQNLTDREYFRSYQFLNQAVVRPGQPITAQVSISASF